MPDSLLGEYLRARRGLLAPADVGLSDGSRRRVPGLRREEVALIAGISADYYLRLEQGRGGRPSEQVLRSLARALRLDDAATRHLITIAAGSPPTAELHSQETVPDSVLNLVRLLPWPAFVTGRTFDVLASNGAARALSPELIPGRNRLRSFFLVDAERALYCDWQDTAQRFVAIVRDAIGSAETQAPFQALVGELSGRSPDFTRLWAAHDVSARDPSPALLNHPHVGPLRLHLERLDVAGAPGQSLLIYHPEIGSPDAEKLVRLD